MVYIYNAKGEHMKKIGNIQRHIIDRITAAGTGGRSAYPVAGYRYVVFELLTTGTSQPAVARAVSSLIKAGVIGKDKVDHRRKIILEDKVRTVKASLCDKWAITQDVLYLIK